MTADTSSPGATRLAALLARLDGASQSAGHAYEQLRGRLVQYFRLSLPVRAEELADESLDRLARRIDDVAIDDPARYVLGIARLVLKEAQQQRSRQQRALDDPTLLTDDADDPCVVEETEQRERALLALRHCLAQAGDASTRLILDYYGGDGAQHIALRVQLAERLGIGINALRNRALRLRSQLQNCVERRLSDRDGATARDENTRNTTAHKTAALRSDD